MEDDFIYVSSDDDSLVDDDNDDHDVDDREYPEPESDNESSSTEPSSCKVIRKESLLAAQKEDLQRVVDLLSLKEHQARTLLIHYRWDVDKVFEVLTERGKEKLYVEAGVTLEGKEQHPVSQPSTETTCQICFEDFPAEKMTLMDCNHQFCNDCWTEHFIVKINEGKSKRITCMALNCNAICDEAKIRDLVTSKDPNLAEKFHCFLLQSYIEDNKRVKWCPSVPHCGNAICAEYDEYCEVECACGLQFCFKCSSTVHSPCSCLIWKLWMRKCEDESETVNWITINAKYCPKCHKPVEKNGGCNLVRCICGQSFCWLCGGATGFEHTWTSIAGHTCGRYKEEEEKKIEKAKKEHWRFSHYYNRYKAHTDSLKAEATLKSKLLEKVRKLEARKLVLKDFNWVLHGYHGLIQPRRVLSNSYPFAFFMFGSELFENELTQVEREIKQNLFEEQQQLLETNIERLSMVLEEPFADYPEDKLMEIRMKIITLSKVTDGLCKKLYHCIDYELYPLQHATHIIAPYRSSGVEKASELPN